MDDLFKVWDGRVRREADLCCYFLEKARAQIKGGRLKRAGLLATQAVRRGANQETLRRIKETGDIFFAAADRPWILDGANVRISMVGFDDGTDTGRELDLRPVEGINADLSSKMDLTVARVLPENDGLSYMGDTKVGPFELDYQRAQTMLRIPNPDGRSNRDVLRPWINGDDVTKRPRNRWIIDFPPGTSEHQAALYEAPFEYALFMVKPFRRDARS
ncbi:MAG: class I SAM-dependent DNA methyltransferase, partial [Acidobacteria bacterium]|nr:class I SAM-dependent DNA methyltransferase [Acidobacteriota bacterium]